MSVTDERKKTISFSDIYYNSAAVIIGPKNDDKDFSPEHLSGKNIGVQVSTTHSRYLDKYYAPKGGIVKTYATQDEANADLAAGRLDYVMADGVALDAFLASEQGTACCEQKGAVPLDVEILERAWALAFARKTRSSWPSSMPASRRWPTRERSHPLPTSGN